MDLPGHLGEMRLFLITCVTHARWRSLAVQQLGGNSNVFRDRPTSWGKRCKNCGGQTRVSNCLYTRRGHLAGPLGVCSRSRLWPVVLSLPLHLCCAERVSSVLQQLCPVTPCLGHHLPVAPTGARGWRCTSNSSKLLRPWTVGGEEPMFLSGRKCLKIKIHL